MTTTPLHSSIDNVLEKGAIYNIKDDNGADFIFVIIEEARHRFPGSTFEHDGYIILPLTEWRTSINKNGVTYSWLIASAGERTFLTTARLTNLFRQFKLKKLT